MGRDYKHLSLEERVFIETQLSLGICPSVIARGLSRAATTVLRELRRNGWQADGERARPRVAGGYRCLPADRRARRLAAKPRVEARMAAGSELRERVIGYLRQGLSPAQIARTLARMPDPVRLSYETIYNSLYAMPRGHLRSSLLKLMRRHHHARRPQRGNKGPQKPPIPEMVLIDQRPSEATQRLIPGHWEGDLIMGKGNRSQVGVLVDRKTLFLALVQLDSTRADHVAPAFAQILNRFDSQLRRSMTFDQGSEMRHYRRLQESTGIQVYFAHPHSPWERGICENTNGLLRQYLPKGTDLSIYSQEQLDDIAWRMNTRPRKTLAWKAPAELFLPHGAFDFVQYWGNLTTPVALGP
ncbi:MAG: IS30 family transposase [Terracidiphilus sp.]|nr:IS30 family transposase [Terracidiphilus sp.]